MNLENVDFQFGDNMPEEMSDIQKAFENVDVKTDCIYIGTNEDMLENAKNYIDDTLCYFNTEFLEEFINLPDSRYEERLEIIEALKNIYESSNSAFRVLIGENMDDFINKAIEADGLGHFVSSYDGELYSIEINNTTYYYVYA